MVCGEIELKSPNLVTKLRAYLLGKSVIIADLTDTECGPGVEDESCFFVHLPGYQQSIDGNWPTFAGGV